MYDSQGGGPGLPETFSHFFGPTMTVQGILRGVLEYGINPRNAKSKVSGCWACGHIMVRSGEGKKSCEKNFWRDEASRVVGGCGPQKMCVLDFRGFCVGLTCLNSLGPKDLIDGGMLCFLDSDVHLPIII
jgi:hypothetical protein